jgi:hypothetical protein
MTNGTVGYLELSDGDGEPYTSHVYDAPPIFLTVGCRHCECFRNPNFVDATQAKLSFVNT